MALHNLYVITFPRKHDYLTPMIVSLRTSGYRGLVTFFPGSNDESHLAAYRGVSGYAIVPWAREDLADKRLGVRYNQARALAYGTGPALVCEDDVEFHVRWRNRLARTLRAIEAAGEGDDYILDVGKGETDLPGLTGAGDEYVRYLDDLQGSWAVYYPGDAVRQYISSRLTRDLSNCSDVAIGRFAPQVLVAVQGCCYHRGQVSTFPIPGA